MTNEQYDEMRKELLRRKTYPYIFHNRELAKDFYERFVLEVPTARYYEQDEIGQIITHDHRAELKLCKVIESLVNQHKKEMVALGDCLIDVEDSIRSKQTRIKK